MLIRSIRIESFRKLQDAALGPFSSGLNLVCEPNEAGKSTVLEALRAAFFERHGANSERTRSFRPYGDEVAPEVTVAFEVAGESWTLRKRFLQGPSVALGNGRQRYESDAAEDQLQKLLGLGRPGNRGADEESAGALGLLWVEQGAALGALKPPADRVKKTLEGLLANEVGTVTGGAAASAVEAEIETALDRLKTKTGRPRGDLAEAMEARAAAQSRLQAAQNGIVAFEDVLQKLDAQRAEMRRIRRDLDDEAEAERGRTLHADLERARLAREQLRSAELVEQAARGEHARAVQRIEQRARDRAALDEADAAFQDKRAAAARDAAVLEAARQTEGGRADDVALAAAALEAADTALQRVRERERAAIRLRAVARAFERLDGAAARVETLKALEAEFRANRVSDDMLNRLEGIDRRLTRARAALAPQLATLDIVLEPGAPAVRLNGKTTHGVSRLQVAAATEIAIEQVGRFVITPASGIAAAADLRAAESEMKVQLAQSGQSDLAAARLANRRRTALAGDIKNLRERVLADCPADPVLGIDAGFDALRAFLAGESRTIDDASGSDELAEAEAAWTRARSDERAAQGRRDAAGAMLRDADAASARSAAAAEAAGATVAQLTRQLGDSEAGAADHQLQAEAGERAAALTGAASSLAAQRASAELLDGAQIERAIAEFDRRRTELERTHLEHVRMIAALEQEAGSLASTGPTAILAAASEELEFSGQRAGRLEEEAEVLTLLNETIKAARAEATRRYLAPVSDRIAPYLGRLLPGARLSFRDFAPGTLARAGRDEEAGDLSRGTQEQIAVLTRLAFADLMMAGGQPVTVVLDDALVWSDDNRFEAMRDILLDAATRMQIIILTCRASAFRGLEATRLSLGDRHGR
jgi:DNA repair exonuclease SbcCD ATPase subunit